MLTLPISSKCNHSKIYREINNSEVIRARIHVGQRCLDHKCVLLRLTREGGGLEGGWSFRVLKLITQLWLRIQISVRSVTKRKAVRRCLPTSITYWTRFGRKNRRSKRRFVRQKRDLSEQTMPGEHLRPHGYPGQMARNYRDNKVEPRVTDLTLKMTQKYYYAHYDAFPTLFAGQQSSSCATSTFKRANTKGAKKYIYI